MNKNKLNVAKNSWILISSIFLLIGILVFLLIEKKSNKPIKIGFSAQLTGSQAELGVQERNGAQLAIETINASGGIAGRKLELVVRDDFGKPEKAQLADSQLIKEGVVAIIGHATSAQTLAALKVTNPANVVLLSPTVSTPELNGLDDYFFRVYPSFKESAETFSKHIYEDGGINRMAVVYDCDNLDFSKIYSKTFIDKFKSLGGTVTNEISFSSISYPDFSSLLLKLQEDKPQGLLIIASDMDTALISQRAQLMGWQVPFFATAWSQTDTLIKNGGHAVEGMELEQSYALTSQSPTFSDFQSRYQTRFGNAPSFGAAFSYEAGMVLAEALKNTGGKAEGLKNALLQTHDFKGLMDAITINKFGDVERDFYLSTVRNGKFIVIDKLTTTNLRGE